MGTENEPVGDLDCIPTIPTHEWNQIVKNCYSKFLSPTARRSVSKEKSPKLFAYLARLHDFSTVVEANRATKAGDIGRLISMWKVWSIMSQSLTKLVNYRSYLPRLVLLLNHILTPSMSKLIRHSILISPSGRPNHFVPKDFFLETQNYWLKFFYNQSGIGTKVERLQEMFSLNMTLVSYIY